MTKKKIVKLAVIRKNDASPCPFGLSIPFGCRNAGTIIDNMAHLKIVEAEEDQEKIAKANNKLLTWKLVDSAEKPVKCKYAQDIIENKNAVNCNFTDAAPGVPSAPFEGSPFYSTTPGMYGLYTYPLGFYADFNVSRNLFYGIFSLQGSHELKHIQKQSNINYTDTGACLLIKCDDEYLLLKRSENSSYPGAWGLPGGHIEKGELPSMAAAREFYEEMGFVPDINDLYQEDVLEKDKCIIFIIKINDDTKNKWEELIKLNNEHDEYYWFKITNIPQNLHPVAAFAFQNINKEE